MSTRQPNGGFNAVTGVVPSGAQPLRPSGARSASFSVADNSNSALRMMIPRPGMGSSTGRFGTPQAASSGKLSTIFTGAGTARGESTPRYATGAGGMSAAALAQIERQVPATPSAAMQMPGSIPRFGRGADWGYGAPTSHTGIRMLGPGAMGSFDARPTQLDSNSSTRAAPDARQPGTVGGPNGSPLAGAVLPSTDSAGELTEQRPYEDVNPIIQKGMIVRPLAPNFSPDDCYAQFMVIHRSVSSLNTKNGAGQGLFRGPAIGDSANSGFRFTMLPVTAFNYIMASREIHPNQNRSGPADSAWNKEAFSVTELLASWEIAGLTINDAPMSAVDHTASRRSAVNGGGEHLLNICNAGPASAYNYWGRNALRSACKLYFVLKRVQRRELSQLSSGRPLKAEAKRYLDSIANQGNANKRKRLALSAVAQNTLYYQLGENKDALSVFEQDAEGRQLHPAPYQLVPYATDSAEGVPLRVRQFRNLDGSKDYGVAFFVGYTVDPLVAGEPGNAGGSMISATNLANSGQLRIHVNIETMA